MHDRSNHLKLRSRTVPGEMIVPVGAARHSLETKVNVGNALDAAYWPGPGLHGEDERCRY
jgi:hypothetical protein